MGGLAVAGASATILNLFHPYDSAATDLLVHAAAVAIVIIANWGLVDRSGRNRFPRGGRR